MLFILRKTVEFMLNNINPIRFLLTVSDFYAINNSCSYNAGIIKLIMVNMVLYTNIRCTYICTYGIKGVAGTIFVFVISSGRF